MGTPTILAVDDEEKILGIYQTHLTEQGYSVRTASSGEEALLLARKHKPDLVILDLMLPGLSGFDVCEQLRQSSSVPIIVVSAKGQDRDKVEALDLGADDYLVKPFSTNELTARVRAVLRRISSHRSQGVPSPPNVRVGKLHIDFTLETVTIDGKPVRLSPTEYCLLRVLAVNAGTLLTHSTLLRLVWGAEYRDEVHYLRVFIRRLRLKIESDPEHPRYIITEPRAGYRFDPDPSPP
ncbi:MAG: response regulator transcription factor [Chloroflexota bacterium]|nr:MAG: response regulator transcription factor [Chloroflexota bacterium]